MNLATFPQDQLQGWVLAIQSAAETWSNIPTSDFVLNYDEQSGNIISFQELDNPDWLAVSAIPPANGPIEVGEIKISPNWQWDTNVPITGWWKFSAQSVITHEFGHWLFLNDIYHPFCDGVTMYWETYAGDDKQISLEMPDINAINYQYPSIIP